jgi:hypothetical protein
MKGVEIGGIGSAAGHSTLKKTPQMSFCQYQFGHLMS